MVLDIADMPTRLTPAVSLSAMRVRSLPRLALQQRAKTTKPLPRNEFATEAMPPVPSNTVVQDDIVTQAVLRFIREQHTTPVAVLLSPLRLLTIPSNQWTSYPVFDEGGRVRVALFAATNIDTDRAIPTSVMPMKEYPDSFPQTNQGREWWEKGGER